jgi:hypothetical protein
MLVVSSFAGLGACWAGTISGHVTRDGYTPVGGVQIFVAGATATTDGSGAYQLTGLPTGDYVVTPYATNYIFMPHCVDLTLSTAASEGTADFDSDFVNGVDSTPPLVWIGSPSDGGAYSALTSVSGWATDGAGGSGIKSTAVYLYRIVDSVNWYWTGTAWELYDAQNPTRIVLPAQGGETWSVTAPLPSSWPVGPVHVSVRVYDNANHYTWAYATFNIVASPPAGTYVIAGNITNSVNGNSLGSIAVFTNGASTMTDGTGHYELSVSSPGDYTVVPSKAYYTFTPASRTVHIDDSNRYLSPVSFTGTIPSGDSTPPTVRIGYPANGKTYTSLSRIAGTALDYGTGVRKVYVYIYSVAQGAYWNGTSWGASYYSFLAEGTTLWSQTAGLPASWPDGNYTIYAGAYDNAGLYATATPVNFTIGTTPYPPPVECSISGNVLNAVYPGGPLGGIPVYATPGNASTTGGGTALTDAAGHYEVTGLLTPGRYVVTPYRENFTFTPTSGEATVDYTRPYATDINFSGSFTGTDTTPPTVTIACPANGGTYTGLTSVSGTASDSGTGASGVAWVAIAISDVTGVANWDGSSWGPYNPNTCWHFANGTTSWSKTTGLPTSWPYGNQYRVAAYAKDNSGRSSFTVLAYFTIASDPGPGHYVINGRVTNTSGSALGGVTVRTGSLSTKTDMNGLYQLAGLDAGTYEVVPSHPSYDFAPISATAMVESSQPYHNGVDFVGTYTGAGSDTTAPQIGITYPVSGHSYYPGLTEIRGWAQDAASGVKSVMIQIYCPNNGASWNGTTWGSYVPRYASLAVDPQGNPTAAIWSMTTGLPTNWPYLDSNYYVWARAYDNAGNSTVTGVTIFVPSSGGYTICGNVKRPDGTPVGGVTVTCNGAPLTGTGALGYWELTNLSSGDYTVTPSLTGYTFSPTSRTVTVDDTHQRVTGLDFTATYTDTDVSSPTVTILYPLNGKAYYPSISSVTGVASAGGPSGLDYVEVVLRSYQNSAWVYWNWSAGSWIPAFDTGLCTKRATGTSNWQITSSLPGVWPRAPYVVGATVYSGTGQHTYAENDFSVGDFSAPSLVIQQPATGGTYPTPLPNASGTATDTASGVDYVEVTLCDTSTGNYWWWADSTWGAYDETKMWKRATGTTSWQVGGMSVVPWVVSRTYRLTARAADTAGNISATPYPYSDFQVAYIGGISGPWPTMGILFPEAPGPAYDLTVDHFSGWVLDEGAGSGTVRCVLGYNASGTWTYWNWTTHTWGPWPGDADGRKAASGVASWTVSSDLPTTWTAGQQYSLYADYYPFGDPVSASTTFYVGANGPPQVTISQPANGASYPVLRQVVGRAGNVARVDVSIFSDASGSYWCWQESTWGAWDEAKVWSAATGTTAWQLSAGLPAILVPGTYRVQVRGVDAAENATCTAISDFTILTSWGAPTVLISYPINGSTYGSVTQARGRATSGSSSSGLAQVRCALLDGDETAASRFWDWDLQAWQPIGSLGPSAFRLAQGLRSWQISSNFPPLTTGVVYRLQAVATDAAGNSTVAENQFTVTPEASPLILSGPTVSHITRTGAVVNWTTNVPASSLIGFDTTSRATFDLYGTQAAGPGGTAAHAVTLAGLEPGQDYYLRARSEDGSGGSATSGEISFTTAWLPQPDLAYSGDTTVTIAEGENVTLAATLITDGTTPLTGRTISFICGNLTGTGTTDATGEASLTVPSTRLRSGTQTVYCRFAGDATHLPATATGTITVTRPLTHTIISGSGYFNKGGDRTQRCTFSFRFNADLVAGWLTFQDVRTHRKITANVVSSIVMSPNANNGPGATIVCGPSNEYTLIIDADADSIQIIEGPVESPSYSAQSSQARGSITIEEGSAP